MRGPVIKKVMIDILNPRRVAYKALNAVFEDRKPLDQLFDTLCTQYNLDGRDRAFAHSFAEWYCTINLPCRHKSIARPTANAMLHHPT